MDFILTKMMVPEIFILKFWIQPFPCHERAKQFKERDQLNVTSGSHTCDAKEKDATRHSSLIYCSMGRLPKYLWACFLNFLISGMILGLILIWKHEKDTNWDVFRPACKIGNWYSLVLNHNRDLYSMIAIFMIVRTKIFNWKKYTV